MSEQTASDAFTDFVSEVEPRLKVALCAAFGSELGMEATAHAFAYAWEHWDRVSALANPAGYLWGVGRNRARRLRSRRTRLFESVPIAHLPWVEPALPQALSHLSARQRVAVILVHGLDWTLGEVAGLLGIGVPTVQKHAERGITRLRKELGVEQ